MQRVAKFNSAGYSALELAHRSPRHQRPGSDDGARLLVHEESQIEAWQLSLAWLLAEVFGIQERHWAAWTSEPSKCCLQAPCMGGPTDARCPATPRDAEAVSAGSQAVTRQAVDCALGTEFGFALAEAERFQA